MEKLGRGPPSALDSSHAAIDSNLTYVSTLDNAALPPDFDTLVNGHVPPELLSGFCENLHQATIIASLSLSVLGLLSSQMGRAHIQALYEGAEETAIGR